MTEPIVITHDLVKRAKGDIEPKVMWAIIAGGMVLFGMLILKDQGVVLSPIIEQAAPYVAAILAGYIKASQGVTVLTTENTATGKVLTTESHSGPAVVTASVPVQDPAPLVVEPTAVMPSSAAFVANRPAFGGLTQFNTPDLKPDENDTEILH